ncbi:phage tail tape measure protein [Leptospira interrogans]
MTTTATLGKLVVYFTGDTTGLDKGKRTAESTFKNIEGQAKRVAGSIRQHIGAIAPWVTAAGAAAVFTRAMQNVIATARQLDVFSTQTGIAVSSLNELRVAAELAGSSFDDLISATSTFTTSVRAEPLSRAAQALREVGISARNAQGDFVTLDEALPLIADKFAGWADGAEKASVATALFGEAGIKLLPFLNRGAQGIADLRKEAASYSTSMNAETVQKTKDFNAAIVRMSEAFNSLVLEATPAVELLTKVTNAIAAAIRERNRLSNQNDFERATADWEYQLEVVRKMRTLLSETKVDLEEAQKLHGAGSIEVARLEQSYEHLTEDLAKAVALQKELKAALDGMPGAPTQLPGLTVDPPKPKPTDLGDPRTGPDKALQAAMDKLAVMREEMTQFPASISEAFSVIPSEFDGVHAEIDRLTQKYGQHADTVRQLAAMKKDLWRQEQDVIMDTATAAASALTAVFGKSKAAAIGSAIINTAVGVTRAFRDVPWPYNIVQAALVAATGAAQIASIRSTTEKGGGGGGGGGSVGGGSAAPSAEAASASRSLTIQGVDPSAMYSGAVVGNLIRAINVEVQNGATLIATKNLPF